MENINTENIDILGELENLNPTKQENTSNIEFEDIIIEFDDEESISYNNKDEELVNLVEKAKDDILTEQKPSILSKIKFLKQIIFIFKYISTSALIFAVLLVTTNYSAYINIAMSYLDEENLNKNEELMISSVKASYIQEKINKNSELITLDEGEHSKLYTKNLHSIKKMINKTDKENINLDIEIIPYENRVIIPKIGQNIPLLDVENRMVSSEKELNNIFMTELENGIIRYPGSAKPGKNGNSFIFGHSSNFPWIKGDYNEVFALLDKLNFDDEIIVYYGQEKFKYKIREKKVIDPNNVSLLKRNNNKSEITLMTCWPIGTTLNRLIVTGELIKE